MDCPENFALRPRYTLHTSSTVDLCHCHCNTSKTPSRRDLVSYSRYTPHKSLLPDLCNCFCYTLLDHLRGNQPQGVWSHIILFPESGFRFKPRDKSNDRSRFRDDLRRFGGGALA
ncbi:hypothetical protein RRG08_022898 [Elysia crispata]|uniref:Uncharacterized protein n=1 Tax=Elysia crispata TaxID=231223 RepID=A0AAE1CJN3_9GAST|nr:hypothetical protein RRG08_022898 [Elysia crispata]